MKATRVCTMRTCGSCAAGGCPLHGVCPRERSLAERMAPLAAKAAELREGCPSGT